MKKTFLPTQSLLAFACTPPLSIILATLLHLHVTDVIRTVAAQCREDGTAEWKCSNRKEHLVVSRRLR